MRQAVQLGSALLLMISVLVGEATAASGAEDDRPAFEAAKRLGRGVNLGNALEAPREGAWGMELQAEFFALIRQVGFDSVRLPIRWSAHAAERSPYTIDAAFFARVDWAIGEALKNNLAIVLNVHHYEEMDRTPDAHKARLLSLWGQIAEHYLAQPETVYFELYNEPHDQLTDERWNALIPELLQRVRPSNPHRAVIIGPGQWNSVDRLDRLRLPESDRRLIATVHHYKPFEFTHQNANWVQGSAKWKGRTWTDTPAERSALEKDFRRVADWSREQRRPIYLGEFGAYSEAEMASRTRWTAAVAREAEKHGFAWAYWEYGAGFGVYDRSAKTWREPLLKALLPALR
jgi:endoglucanase